MTFSTARLLFLAMALTALPPSAHAQAIAASPAADTLSTAPMGEPGSELTVYVLTMGPGGYIWERFGHNAIWIHDERAGTDVAYNWGLFSFEQENFLLRFIRGQMDYWMAGMDANLMATAYVRADRSVWAQELALTPAQRVALRDFVEWNARPENRVYRYDYFRDNCSTRVRDALDRVLGGELRAQTAGVPSGATYRDHTRTATAPTPLMYTAIMLGLGPRTDREISAWEEMFMPLAMWERIRDVSVELPDGQRVPLVKSEQVIYLSTLQGEEPVSPPPVWIYLGMGVVYGGGIVAAARASDRRRDSRAGLRLMVGAWGIIGGILGTVLVGLWFLTDHVAAYANENLFHFNPLLLAAGVLVPMAARVGSPHRRKAYLVSGSVAGLSLLGLVLGALPLFPQENASLLALALPINLSVAYAARRLERREPASVAEGPPPPARDQLLPNPA